ncbi:bifunctional DNA primase/polymerase [Promicromonospora soli]
MDTTPDLWPRPLAAVQRAAGRDTVADAAVLLAAAGVPVFPCRPGEERPRTPRGVADASRDPDRVAWWWSRYPTANIGMPTGAASGIDVVDVGARDGGSGFPAVRAAQRAGLVDGWGLMVATPARGLQLYFPHAPGSEQRSWSGIGVQVDFRGEGGYVVVPPSLALDDADRPVAYRPIMVARHRAAPVDAAALRQLVEPSRPHRFSSAWAAPDATAGPAVLATWLASRPYDGRSRRLSWAARRMAEHGFDRTSTLTLLGPAAHHTGMDEQTIEQTVASAFRQPAPLRAPARAARAAAELARAVPAPDPMTRPGGPDRRPPEVVSL